MAIQDLVDAKIAAHESKRFRDTSASFAAVSAVGAALLYAMGAVSNEVQFQFFGIAGAVKQDVYAALLDGALITLIFGPILYLIVLARHARYRREVNEPSEKEKKTGDAILSRIFSAYPESTLLDFILFMKAVLALIYTLIAASLFGFISALILKYSTESRCFGCIAYVLETETIYGRPIATDGERLVVYLRNGDIRVFAWDGVTAVHERSTVPKKKVGSKVERESADATPDATASPSEIEAPPDAAEAKAPSPERWG